MDAWGLISNRDPLREGVSRIELRGSFFIDFLGWLAAVAVVTIFALLQLI
jgi:hypothetical protein